VSDFARPPRLLVSVRSVEEAHSALAGGADIIDVKEPSRGSLGRADADVVAAIASMTEPAGSQAPLSVALGEVREHFAGEVFRLPPSVRYAKLGLALLRDDADWLSRWVELRQEYDRAAGTPREWIAVIYADARHARSPAALEIIEAAAFTGCAGVLVDTYAKTRGRLLEHIAPQTLAAWASAARSRGLMFAAAGRLSSCDLPLLTSAAVDVIAVRSAVCEGDDRLAAVCPTRVAVFKKATKIMAADAPLRAAIR